MNAVHSSDAATDEKSIEQQADIAPKERTPLKFNKVNIRSLRTGLRAGLAADTSTCGQRGCHG